MRWLNALAAAVLRIGIAFAVRIVAAPRVIWAGTDPAPRQRVYFANHTSNADLPLIWVALPPELRRLTRPVAAADYWLKNWLRENIGRHVFDAVLVDRRPDRRDQDPVAMIRAALDSGDSLIIFPEGRRNDTDEPLLPLKAGLYNIAVSHPKVELIPVWIENLNRVMPRGETVPIPMISTVCFGAPLPVRANEGKDEFLARAAQGMLAARDEL